MLTDNRMLEKFHVANRIRSRISDIFNMAHLRSIFFRVHDFYPELDFFILEKYHIPSNYNDLQRRMQKERMQLTFKIEDHHDPVAAQMRYDGQKYLRENSNYIWILDPRNGDNIKIMPVNPDSASDIAKISQYMPCLVQRRLTTPFLFKKKAVNKL